MWKRVYDENGYYPVYTTEEISNKDENAVKLDSKKKTSKKKKKESS